MKTVFGIEYPNAKPPHCDVVSVPTEHEAQFIYNLGVMWRERGQLAFNGSRVHRLLNYQGPSYLQFK